MSEYKLTSIITVRAAPHYDMVARLRNRLLDTQIPPEVCFLVVDDGSPEPFSSEIRGVCDELGFRYVRHQSGKQHFCASSSRNLGAMKATSRYIIHEDIDLFPYPGFYRDLLAEIEIQELDRYADRFLTVPCLYLTEAATDQALAGKIAKNEILHSHLVGTGLVATALPASSAILVDRHYYLSIGGYNEQFNGWGLEDLEYAYRLTRGLNQFIAPQDPSHLVEGGYSSYSAYRGWRSQFRLHGDLLARKGIFLFHAYHPKDTTWRNPDAHSRNKSFFLSQTKKFDEMGHHVPSLPAPENGKSLIFGRGTFAYNRSLFPLWGELEVKAYEAFADIDVVEYCRENNINRVIFTNPYASEQRLRIYNRVREAGIAFVVVERGALPDSMFIDDTGFCCESTRYKRQHWPTELDDGRKKRVLEYISEQTSSSLALERQGERLGRRGALEKLGIPASKKVLFVPFQSRSDTTVTFFAGRIGSFNNFVSLVQEVTKRLPLSWTVVFKNHPLSSVKEEIPGAIDIGDMHINDALEIADYTLLMNSGVGVLSAMFGKPVIHTAQAFYSDEALNREAATAEEVLSLLSEGFSVDRDCQLRFMSYLLEDFYSFGKFTVREKRHTDNASLTITERIDYYRVNYLGRRVFDTAPAPRMLNHKAPIYDIFREWIISKKHSEKTGSLKMVLPSEQAQLPKAPSPSAPPRQKLATVLRPVIAISGSEKGLRKYDRDPARYFTDLKSPLYRGIGRLLFQPNR